MADYNDLTLEEKLDLWSIGTDYRFLTFGGKFEQVMMADGPIGVKVAHGVFNPVVLKPADEFRNATCHASHSVLANSWNRELCYDAGKYIADEAVEYGVDLLLAPSINIKRTPLGGRNFEYFSEDPYLAGLLAAEYIRGVQEKGIGACPKHFVANNREHNRWGQSSEVDERTLREIYFKVFEIAFRQKPMAVMSSYNLLNGIYVDENGRLLQDVLKKELGFDGIIVSDGGAVRDAVKSFKAGLNCMEPRKEETTGILLDAYRDGRITDEDVERAVLPVVKYLKKAAENKKKYKIEFSVEQRHAQTVREAEEGIVLLKNDGNILPLKKGKKIAVFGSGTENAYAASGSAKLNPATPIKPLETCLKENLPDTEIVWHPAGGPTLEGYNTHILDCSLQMAYEADCCIVNICENTDLVGEVLDRTTLKLHPALETVIEEIAAVNENTVVNLFTGSAVDMTGWIDKVKAVVYVGFAGEGMTEGLANLLCGKVSFSGKLAETFPLKTEDAPSYSEKLTGNVEVYRERQFVGYRYYDTCHKPVLFPFGYGLSYAKFRYGDFSVMQNGETEFTVDFYVYNDSDTDAKEIVQLYIRDVSSYVSKPYKELRNFDKVFVKARGKAKVSLSVTAEDFRYWSAALNEWTIEDGWYELQIGASVEDIRFCYPLKIGNKPIYY